MVISPIISAGSSALQALESLFLAKPPGSASNAAGAFSTGQSLPTGGTTQGAAAPSNPSDQFAQSTLSFLTSLQDTASGAVSGLLTDAKSAFTNDVGELTSALNTLKQALGGASGSTSSASASSLSTASTSVSPLAAGTSSALLQALTQLGSTLQGFAALQGTGGGHHHHRHGGWGATQTDASSAATTSSASATPSVPATTPTTG